jgi:hypothetical protein
MYIADAINSGRLDEVRRQGARGLPQPRDLYGHAVFQEKLDLNGDGKDEYVYVESAGTARFESVVVYDENLQRIAYATSAGDNWESDRLRWPARKAIVTFEGVHYIVGMNDDRLSYAATVSPEGELAVVCEFGQRPEPAARIIESRNDAVCGLALDGALTYSAYDRLHAYEADRVPGPGQTSPSELAAVVDFDNDGTSDVIIEMSYSSGAGAGCGFTTLAALDETRSSLVTSPTTELLRSVGGGCQGMHVRPFAHDGIVYLENKYPEGFPQPTSVVKIEDGRVENVCRIEAHAVNYVLGALESLRASALESGAHLWTLALQEPGVELAEQLIASGFDVNEHIDDPGRASTQVPLPRGSTPLMIAAAVGRVDLVMWLLDRGAELRPSETVDTPLTIAVIYQRDDVVELLLARGADPNAPGRERPIDLATSGGTPRAVELLTAAGAKRDTFRPTGPAR